jgi:hypothetical protein
MSTKSARRLRRLAKVIWLYPPYLGAGISVKSVNASATSYVVQLKRRWYNRNVYGSHFGGSLYAMVDPFFVFAAAAYFGDDYILWDKSAAIEYVSPGRGTVFCEVSIPEERLREMKAEVDQKGKSTFHFDTVINSSEGKLVAKVEKEIYIRKK